jgi:hypothetical protein
MSRTFAKRIVNQYLGWVHVMRSPRCKSNLIANDTSNRFLESEHPVEFRKRTVVTSYDDIYSTKRKVKVPIESKLDDTFWKSTGYTPSIEQRIARLQVYIEDAELSLAYHTDVLKRLDAVRDDTEINNWYLADFWKSTNSFNTVHSLKWQLDKFKAELQTLKGKHAEQTD